MKKANAVMACKPFQQESHNFKKHGKCTIFDQLMNTFNSKQPLTQRLRERENFLFLKLDTLYQKSFTMELSK